MSDLIDRQYVTDTNVGNNDLISRQDAIDALNKLDVGDGVGISSIACSVQESAISAIQHLPSSDAIEVVRCWNCVWWDNCPSSTITPNFHKCKRVGRMSMPSDGFCSHGERKDGNIYNNSAAELSRLQLSLETEMEIAKHIMEEAEKACAECQEFDCDGCIYRGYRNG